MKQCPYNILLLFNGTMYTFYGKFHIDISIPLVFLKVFFQFIPCSRNKNCYSLRYKRSYHLFQTLKTSGMDQGNIPHSDDYRLGLDMGLYNSLLKWPCCSNKQRSIDFV